MAFTQSDVDALKKAIAGGVSSVRFADGRQVTYRTIPELIQALATAEAEVAATSGAPSVTFATYCKG